MQTLKIGQLARAADVHIQTLRFYERKGILKAGGRTEKGYRLYDPDDVIRIRFIKQAQKLGFSLREVIELLELKVDRKSKCADVERRAEAKIEEIDRKIESLQKMRNILKTLTKACRGTVPTSECAILKAFENPSSQRHK